MKEITRTEIIIDGNGLNIILQFNGEPTIESYEFIRDYIDLRLKGMSREIKDSSLHQNLEPLPTFNKFSDLPMGGMNPPSSVRVGDRDNQIFDYNGTEWLIAQEIKDI